ncbi:bifunctional hydroxymethylpyrimidine kinase/phosphomethylpyrimidine kinase [Xylella fastidiosa subsp. multiplex]|uniref:hydroxymethylpyrimidine kinase n=1 Tax=Xylella fastidiosa subsp. multiplex TaxID=644357 RepID=A0AAW6HXB4_XYLFS|nr:bifunctional hydroxymethylpyrimidine kinase/phosphomethylpyrimidine kinase [Xylella fastidiosa]ERI61052.1 phosphomethylpyrimidine kinase [Xylella fastidiosa subsp. multiplex Griffin-1]ACA12592.1 phosphomethylpyrimidine kinase [Xylella fastidiosa M12]KAJ4853218.1 bifunctional hydroxymethylpyrimidine kinase/phosphomethylpyrimidine kinase [Xylella fastidiosa subsp. multiplex]MBS9444809.1 bifunctional hydroxymethylpyrimidine kinase/phosphomethylpyrimidine kinase [Xylella fastidiosa subsp. multip
MNIPNIISALTIAGSDTGGGAGIQADLKTFAAHHVHGLSAITVLTAQHTRGVNAVHIPPLEFIATQIDTCFSDFNVHAVKLGMLTNAKVITLVAEALQRHQPPCIVLDPVMIATSGSTLLEDSALEALRTQLLPLATLITPNIPEAERLLNRHIHSSSDADTAAASLLKLGAHAVLLKGGHLNEGNSVIDRFDNGTLRERFSNPRLALNAHGTGCTLSSAITAQLCLGLKLHQACKAGIDYVARVLHAGYRPGHGNITVLNHIPPKHTE